MNHPGAGSVPVPETELATGQAGSVRGNRRWRAVRGRPLAVVEGTLVRIEVVYNELHAAARELAAITAEVRDVAGSLAAAGEPAADAAGEPAAASAAGDFCARWSGGLDALGERVSAMALATTLAALAYDMADRSALPPGGAGP